jgi:hypothetical protein
MVHEYDIDITPGAPKRGIGNSRSIHKEAIRSSTRRLTLAST